MSEPIEGQREAVLSREHGAGRSGHNLDVVRRSNLSLVLGRVHELRAVSRAQLTRETGLNRSTIAALVAELAQRGLVVETSPDPTNQVGRPSPVIVPSERVVAITVHPELDSVSVAVVQLGGTVVRQVRYATDRILRAQEVVNIAAAIIDGMRVELESYLTVGIGLAVPGLVRASDGVVILAPHLEWENEPVGDMLRDATGYSVRRGQRRQPRRDRGDGARRGARGVPARVRERRGERHRRRDRGGRGAARRGIRLRGRTRAHARELVGRAVPLRCDWMPRDRGHPRRTRSPCSASTSPSSTASSRSCWPGATNQPSPPSSRGSSRYLGRGIANVVNLVNPQLVVLGGFLGPLYDAAPDVLEDAVRATALAGTRDDVRFIRSELGPALLPVGAAELAFGPLIADPASRGTP